MARSNRLFAAVLGLVLSTTLILQADMTVAAGSNDTMRDLRGGVAALLNPGVSNTTEIVSEQAQQLNVQFVDKTEDNYESLVMANVEDVLDVRSEANEDAEIIGKVYKDCGGTILDRRDGWTQLQSGNVVGWTKDENLLFGEDAYKLAKDVGRTIATVTSESIRVRKAPEMDAEVHGLLPKGEIAEVVEDEDETADDSKTKSKSKKSKTKARVVEKTPEGWVRINYDGKEGYLQTEYVSLRFTVDAGETIAEIKAREKAEKSSKTYVNYGEYTADTDTMVLLAALIHCEAGGEPYEGQVAVGAVVLNRVRSSAYPDTIHGVIYASGQFTPAMTGKLNRVLESGKIYESCFRAAEEALSGSSNVGDRTHFRTVNGHEGMIIGNHVFY